MIITATLYCHMSKVRVINGTVLSLPSLHVSCVAEIAVSELLGELLPAEEMNSQVNLLAKF